MSIVLHYLMILFIVVISYTAQAASTNLSLSFTVITTHNVVIAMTEDAWLGDAQYSLTLDGTVVGSGTVTALRGTTPQQVQIGIPNGTHTIAVVFTNDSYGGTPSTDRNLYVEWESYDGVRLPNSSASLVRNGDTFSEIVPPGAAPVPVSISVNPSTVMIDDKTLVGTRVATATVTMSDGSTNYTGGLNVSGVNFFTVSGMNILLGRVLTQADDGNYMANVSVQ